MEYRIRESGAILTQGEVRKLHANTSFPAVWDQAVCEEIGIDPILQSPQPTPSLTETVHLNGAVQDSLGNWVQNYILSPMFHEYTMEDGTVVTQAEQEQAFLAERNETQWVSVRTQRNKLIADSDWTQLVDTPLTNIEQASWATYRQALRDLTTQEDPFNITWPNKDDY